MSLATLKRKTAALKGRTSHSIAWKTSNSSHRTARIGRCCSSIVQNPSNAENVCGIGGGSTYDSYDDYTSREGGTVIACDENSNEGNQGGGECVLSHVNVGGRQVPYRNTSKRLDLSDVGIARPSSERTSNLKIKTINPDTNCESDSVA